jgi:hypothetical protein
MRLVLEEESLLSGPVGYCSGLIFDQGLILVPKSGPLP